MSSQEISNFVACESLRFKLHANICRHFCSTQNAPLLGENLNDAPFLFGSQKGVNFAFCRLSGNRQVMEQCRTIGPSGPRKPYHRIWSVRSLDNKCPTSRDSDDFSLPSRLVNLEGKNKLPGPSKKKRGLGPAFRCMKQLARSKLHLFSEFVAAHSISDPFSITPLVSNTNKKKVQVARLFMCLKNPYKNWKPGGMCMHSASILSSCRFSSFHC